MAEALTPQRQGTGVQCRRSCDICFANQAKTHILGNLCTVRQCTRDEGHRGECDCGIHLMKNPSQRMHNNDCFQCLNCKQKYNLTPSQCTSCGYNGHWIRPVAPPLPQAHGLPNAGGYQRPEATPDELHHKDPRSRKDLVLPETGEPS
jgi:hypothetical protein